MRLFLVAATAAASLLTAGIAAAPASARPHWDHGHNRGWHGHGPNRHWHHGRCRTVWHHGHRVRRCW